MSLVPGFDPRHRQILFVWIFFFFTPRPNVLRKDEISWTKGEKPGKTHTHTTHQRTGTGEEAGQLGVLIIELITIMMTEG